MKVFGQVVGATCQGDVLRFPSDLNLHRSFKPKLECYFYCFGV